MLWILLCKLLDTSVHFELSTLAGDGKDYSWTTGSFRELFFAFFQVVLSLMLGHFLTCMCWSRLGGKVRGISVDLQSSWPLWAALPFWHSALQTAATLISLDPPLWGPRALLGSLSCLQPETLQTVNRGWRGAHFVCFPLTVVMVLASCCPVSKNYFF